MWTTLYIWVISVITTLENVKALQIKFRIATVAKVGLISLFLLLVYKCQKNASLASHSNCWFIFTHTSTCFGSGGTSGDPSETDLHSSTPCSFSCVRVWNDGTPIKLLLDLMVHDDLGVMDTEWILSTQTRYSALHNHRQKPVKFLRHSERYSRGLLFTRGWRSGPFTDENRA